VNYLPIGLSAGTETAMRFSRLARLGTGVAGVAALTTPPLAFSLRASHVPNAPHGVGAATDKTKPPLADSDPHMWLEEIEGAGPLAWCREQNARTVSTIGDPERSDAYAKILAIADSKDKIPHVVRPHAPNV